MGVATIATVSYSRGRPLQARIRLLSVSALAAGSLLLGSCGPARQSVLDEQSLFSMQLGRLEDQVDIISRDGVVPRADTELAMRDGMIYVADGAAGKIMEFTSFGELVRLIYHPDRNPEPVTLAQAAEDGDEVTRVAAPYRFQQLGNVAVDSRRYIYAEDRLPDERAVFDESLGVQLNRIVVRFNDEGVPLDYLGQEGIGGTPFPHIDALFVTVRDELVVVSTTTGSKLVHVFSAEGEQMYVVRIRLDRLPIPGEDDDSIAVLQEVVAGLDAYRIYLRVSYYRPSVAAGSGEQFGIDFDHSRIYWLNLESGRYEGFMELPRGTREDEQTLHHELVGVARGEHVFLLARQDIGQTRLVIMNDAGRVLRRRVLAVPEVELVLRRFALDDRGVLTSFLGFEDRAEIVWWRSDRLLPEMGDGSDEG